MYVLVMVAKAQCDRVFVFGRLQVKCEQYWPERVGETVSVDNDRLIVLLNEVVPFADYELRKSTIYFVS